MDKRYVLRKPIEAHYVSDSNEWYIETLGYINNGEFDEIFTEFDEDATRKQIETILIGHANDIGESDFADSKQHKKITNKAVDAVFSLITGEKETK